MPCSTKHVSERRPQIMAHVVYVEVCLPSQHPKLVALGLSVHQPHRDHRVGSHRSSFAPHPSYLFDTDRKTTA
jgi:hypothetical protein